MLLAWSDPQLRRMCRTMSLPKRVEPKDVECLKTLLNLVTESENLQEVDRFAVAQVDLAAGDHRFVAAVSVGSVVLNSTAVTVKGSTIRPEKRTLSLISTNALLVDDIAIHRLSIRRRTT